MRLSWTAAFAALVLMLPAAAAATDFELRHVAQTDKTVTFAWKPQPGAQGYQFWRNGAVISRTFNPSLTSATFWKGTRYGVQVLTRRADGTVAAGRLAMFTPGTKTVAGQRTALVYEPAPSSQFRLRLLSQTAKTVTFGWKRQPGVDGFQFVRDGVVISRTFDDSTTSASFWKGKRYAVDLLRVTPDGRAKAIGRALAVAGKRSGRQGFVFLSAPTAEFELRLLCGDAKDRHLRMEATAGGRRVPVRSRRRRRVADARSEHDVGDILEGLALRGRDASRRGRQDCRPRLTGARLHAGALTRLQTPAESSKERRGGTRRSPTLDGEGGI